MGKTLQYQIARFEESKWRDNCQNSSGRLLLYSKFSFNQFKKCNTFISNSKQRKFLSVCRGNQSYNSKDLVRVLAVCIYNNYKQKNITAKTCPRAGRRDLVEEPAHLDP